MYIDNIFCECCLFTSSRNWAVPKAQFVSSMFDWPLAVDQLLNFRWVSKVYVGVAAI